MAAEVYEDEIELTVPILEAVLPDSEQYLASAYPYPSLKPTGRMESRRFRAIVLENPYLRATIVPDLGGRILRLLDKRTNTEIFPDEPLTPIEGGLRGVEIQNGIQIRYKPEDRLNALGTINYQLVPAGDEEDDAGVWLGEVAGTLSFNALVSLSTDAAEIKIELRMFNRVIGDTPYNGGLCLGLSGAEMEISESMYSKAGMVGYCQERRAGIFVGGDDMDYSSTTFEKDRLAAHRFGKGTRFSMTARQLDTWKFRLLPFSGFEGRIAAYGDAAILIGADAFHIQAHRPIKGAGLLLTSKSGQNFNAEFDARPDVVTRMPFDHMDDLKSFVVLDQGGRKGLEFYVDPVETFEEDREDIDRLAEIDSQARERMRENVDDIQFLPPLIPSLRYETHLRAALRIGETDKDSKLEQALIYNGEDHLAWWAKATFKRVDGDSSEEIPELLNAHFLAPLEPVLRAESYLSQPKMQGREANPILNPLRESPEQFVEIACLLLGLDQMAEASRFIDEALRHVDLPMLRYLQAYALLSKTSMDVEAATHVKMASKKSFSPPFPWRPVEVTALKMLAKRFSDDERLKQYLATVEKFIPA